jgi:hypothetical protein
VYIHSDRITCPYFTVEFKKDGNAVELAQNQVAVAAALAIYNRALLKVQRLKLTGEKVDTETHINTLHGLVYTFWCIKLKQQEAGLSISPSV